MINALLLTKYIYVNCTVDSPSLSKFNTPPPRSLLEKTKKKMCTGYLEGN
jgi:hypothetical protein